MIPINQSVERATANECLRDRTEEKEGARERETRRRGGERSGKERRTDEREQESKQSKSNEREASGEREGDVLQAVYASRRMRLARKMRSPVPAMIEGSAMNARLSLSLPHSRMHVCLPTYLLLQL